MAKCPNCETNFNFSELAFLSRMSNTLKCKNCNKLIEGDKGFLSSTGAIGGGIGGGLLIWNDQIFAGIEYSFLLALGIAIVLLMFISFYQYKSVPLRTAPEQNPTDKNGKPILTSNPSRVETLKLRYFERSDEQLTQIVQDAGMTSEAQQAAKELLDERKTTSNRR